MRHPKIRALILLDTFSNVPDAANVLLGVPLGFVAHNLTCSPKESPF
jgi:hypothetical protein